jgi:DNA primase
MIEDVVGKILIDLGVDYVENNSSYDISCPFHTSDSSSTTLNISKSNNKFYCFSCHEGGYLPKLVKEIAGISHIEAITYLGSLSETITNKNRDESFKVLFKKINRSASIKEKKSIKDVPLPYNVQNLKHPYLIKRNLTEKEIIYNDIRVIVGKEFRNWILIPIYKDGILRTYFMRNPAGSEKLYGYYPEIDEEGDETNVGYPRSDILYGMDDCTNFEEPLVIAEGIFDSIFNKRVKHQSVATLSNRILKDQEAFILKFKKIIIVPDNDNAGLFLVKDMLKFGSKVELRVANLPKHRKDSAECSIEELTAAIYRAQSIYDFVVSDRYINFNSYLVNLKKRK